ncbi:MAG TPA: hypothetical protein VGM76_19765, partial [Lacipirellulaceae bacterium]
HLGVLWAQSASRAAVKIINHQSSINNVSVPSCSLPCSHPVDPDQSCDPVKKGAAWRKTARNPRGNRVLHA